MKGLLQGLLLTTLMSLAWVGAAHPAHLKAAWDHTGHGSPTHFNVEMRSSNGISWDPWLEIGEVLWVEDQFTYLLEGVDVTPGQHFEIRVNAENAMGVSNWAGPVSTTAPDLPGDPTNLQVITVTILIN